MRAALLDGPERLEVREVDDAVVGAGEVTVRVESVGICGTDLSIFAGKIPVSYPRVMGHEIVGVVEEADGDDVRPGDRVLVDPAIACGTCRQCREGRTNICTRGALLGRDLDGGLRDRVVVPATNLHALPERLDPRIAPMVQVLTTCVHAQRRMPVFLSESVVVLGLGVTGLLHLQLAKVRGAEPLVGVTRSARKLELAGRLGADVVVTADGTESAQVADAVPGGADLVIECVGTVAALARSMEMVRPGGRILAYGTMTETAGELPFYDLYHKEITIVGARAARVEDFPPSIELAASGRIALEPLVSDRYPIDRVPDALRAGSAPGALKILVDV